MAVRTEATLTLKTFSTAWRISTLLASVATSKVTALMIFLLLHALLGHQRANEHDARILHDLSASCEREQGGLLEDHPVVAHDLVDRRVLRRLHR